MAITKSRIWLPPVKWLTGAATALRQCGRTSDWMVHAGAMEKSMTKTPRNTALTESELDKVSGGVELRHEEPHASTTRTECHIFDDGVDLAMFCNRIPFWH
jgi:hypothetical protein